MVKDGNKQRLLGRYRLEEVIAVGGMGTVARAHDDVLHRTVAIKLLKEEYAADPGTVERFQREARIAASLSHPGIAHVFDFGQDNGRSFIVMEFLHGEDLRSRLLREGRLDTHEAVDIVARTADALAHAHQAGAVHRDIKPGNIFLTRSGEVKVTDFGIARAAAEAPVTATGTIIGTFLYLSPEQALGEPVTPASDLYSLGCVLLELLTGKPPFEGDSPAAISMAHVSKPPPSAHEVSPEVPAAVDAVIARSLSKDPADRYRNANEMASALRAAVAPAETSGPRGRVPSLEATSGAAPTVEAQRGPQTQVIESEVSSKSEDKRRRRPRAAGIRRWRPAVAVGLLAVAVTAVVIAADRLGPSDTVKVPNWVEGRIEQARQEAAQLGLTLREQSEGSFRPAGEVLRQSPAPGAEVSPGHSVELVVSSGGDLVVVPDVIGEKLEDAEGQLERSGFKAALATEVEGKKEDLIVTAQDPTPGTIRPKGSTVTLTIAERRGKGRGGGDD